MKDVYQKAPSRWDFSLGLPLTYIKLPSGNGQRKLSLEAVISARVWDVNTSSFFFMLPTRAQEMRPSEEQVVPAGCLLRYGLIWTT